MPKPVKLRPHNLQDHINDHQDRKKLQVGWFAFCAMAEARAGVSSMARTFQVSWSTMSSWLELYERYKLLK